MAWNRQRDTQGPCPFLFFLLIVIDLFLFVLICLVGRTDKKSQSSFPREDKKNAFYSSSKEKQEAKLPKEEAVVRVSLGNAASSRVPSNGTERQNGRQHRGKRDLSNRTETNSTSARGDSRQEDVTTQLPWNKPQVINGDVLGASNEPLIVREKPETDSKRLTREEPVQSSAPVNAFSNRNISKPSLPSILDIADRLNSTKMWSSLTLTCIYYILRNFFCPVWLKNH